MKGPSETGQRVERNYDHQKKGSGYYDFSLKASIFKSISFQNSP